MTVHCLKNDAVPLDEGYCELATLEVMTVTDADRCSTCAFGKITVPVSGDGGNKTIAKELQ